MPLRIEEEVNSLISGSYQRRRAFRRISIPDSYNYAFALSSGWEQVYIYVLLITEKGQKRKEKNNYLKMMSFGK